MHHDIHSFCLLTPLAQVLPFHTPSEKKVLPFHTPKNSTWETAKSAPTTTNNNNKNNTFLSLICRLRRRKKYEKKSWFCRVFSRPSTWHASSVGVSDGPGRAMAHGPHGAAAAPFRWNKIICIGKKGKQCWLKKKLIKSHLASISFLHSAPSPQEFETEQGSERQPDLEDNNVHLIVPAGAPGISASTVASPAIGRPYEPPPAPADGAVAGDVAVGVGAARVLGARVEP